MSARPNIRVPSAKCLVRHSALRTHHSALCALLALSLASLVCGCVYRGAKITEGTDLAIGLTVPGTEGVLQFNALNYLSGFRLGVAENAALTVEYSTVATNSYFGVVTTETAKRIKAKVEPCESGGNAAAVPGAECLVTSPEDDASVGRGVLDAPSSDVTSAPSTEHQALSTLPTHDLSCAAGASSPSNEP